MKRVGVTGAGGFIGRNIVSTLTGCVVDAPGRRELDLCDRAAVRSWLERGRFDCVIHTATHNATVVAQPKPGAVYERNMQMFEALADCEGTYGKMIWFGSGAEFDRRHWRGDLDERELGTHVPADEYGLSKYRMTTLAAQRADMLNLRVFGCYGPYEDWRVRFISQACVRAMWGLPIRVRLHNSFDYLWIDDLVEVVRWFVDHDGQHRVYNVSTGRQVELFDLARLVAQAVERSSGRVVDIEVLGEGRGVPYGGTNTRLLGEMPALRFTPPEVAIPRLLAFHEARRAEIGLADVQELR